MPTVSFHTLGCKLNFSETATLGRQFRDKGFAAVPFEDGADVCVINTCSVTDHADRKCKKLVRQALRANPEAFVVVVGCYAQLKPDEIAAIPGVDAVLGAAEKFRLFDLLGDFRKDELTQVHRCAITETQDFIPTESHDDRTRAFLKVQDGCDYKCSFCTIPLARGASRSDDIANVVARAKALAADGTCEIVLTGVNLGDFGAGRGDTFYDLLNALMEQAPEVARWRLSSVEPNLLSDDIIRLAAETPAVTPHFHLPLQSGSNEILARMRRRYQRELYAERVAVIHALMPDACIGCDVIVGFPGETDAHFDETFDFLHGLEVSYLHVFPFSERNNTPAADMTASVPHAVRTARSEALRNLSHKKRRAFDERFIGETRPVLFEQTLREGRREGWTDNYVRVAVESAPAGQILPVRLEAFAADGVVIGALK